MSDGRPKPTLMDYMAIAISPSMIILLVGSLAFFLLMVFYAGDFVARLYWTTGCFVFAAVLISRVSIEEGAERASLFGIALGVVAGMAMTRFVDHPWWAWLVLGVIWWCASHLVWNCTVVDDDDDASGAGLLEAAGFDAALSTTAAEPKEAPPLTAAARRKRRKEAAAKAANPTPPKQVSPEQPWINRAFAWWQSSASRKAPPGLTVVYFSLAALPIFGFGQRFIATTERLYAFQCLFVYVASALGLLVTTSFLGLRRYLRQRRLEMPVEMAGTWLAVGAAMVGIVLILAVLIPRPQPEYAISSLTGMLNSPQREASPYSPMHDSPAQGESSSGAKKPEGSGQQAEGSQNDGRGESAAGSSAEKPGEKGDGNSSQQGDSSSASGSGQQQSGNSSQSQGQQTQSQQSQGQTLQHSQQSQQLQQNQAAQSGGEKQQEQQQGNSSTSQQSAGQQQSQQQSGQQQQGNTTAESKSDQQRGGEQQQSQQEARQQQAGSSDKSGGQQSEQQQQQAANQNGSSESGEQKQSDQQAASQNNKGSQDSMSSKMAQRLGQRWQQRPRLRPPPLTSAGGLLWLLKMLVYAVVIMAVIYVLIRYGAQVRAFLHAMWRELVALWQSIFGGRSAAADEASDALAANAKRTRPFTSYADPFASGAAANARPHAIVQYSFEALEAWAADHDQARLAEETPLEFSSRLAAEHPQLAEGVQDLASLYARVAYARDPLQGENLAGVRQLWQLLKRASLPVASS